MIEKVKKIGIIIIIAILFALFSFSLVDLVDEGPKYEDFCISKNAPFIPVQKELTCKNITEPSQLQYEDCNKLGGFIEYSYDGQGCPKSFECNTCNKVFEDAGKQHRLIGFIITTIIGVIAIIAGMYINSKQDVIGWIYSGILIGGMISVAIGTIMYFHDMGRFVKPFVLLGEMILIIWIAIRTYIKRK